MTTGAVVALMATGAVTGSVRRAVMVVVAMAMAMAVAWPQSPHGHSWDSSRCMHRGVRWWYLLGWWYSLTA